MSASESFGEKVEAEIRTLEQDLAHHQEAPLPSGPPGSPAPEPEPVSTSSTLKSGTLTSAPAPQTPAPVASLEDADPTEGRLSSLEKTVGQLSADVNLLKRLSHLTDE